MNILLFLVNKFFPGLILGYFISKKQNINTNNSIKMSNNDRYINQNIY
jgi:uncharacterized protein YneF (UPF0154 family)